MKPEIGHICRQHLEYTKWADNLLLGAIQANLPDRAEALGHIYMAERLWLSRIEGNVLPEYAVAPSGIVALAERWPELHRLWLDLAATENDWDRVVSYRMLSGAEGSSPLWQIVLHVANHGSYHRGQVASMLRAAGFTPPATDLIRWYLSQARQ